MAKLTLKKLEEIFEERFLKLGDRISNASQVSENIRNHFKREINSLKTTPDLSPEIEKLKNEIKELKKDILFLKSVKSKTISSYTPKSAYK